jgi:hypothetical protein
MVLFWPGSRDFAKIDLPEREDRTRPTERRRVWRRFFPLATPDGTT